MRTLRSAPRTCITTLLKAAFIFLASAWSFAPDLVQADPNESGQDRPVLVGLTLGARTFNEELELEDQFSFGGRVGLGLGSRWALLVDFVACHTARKSTAAIVYVDALRVLGRMNFTTGKLRPYALLGPGGVLFLFSDAATTAGATLTIGAGADYRVASRTRAFLELSSDLYSQEEATYDIEGDIISVEPEHAEWLGTLSAGIAVEF